MIGGVTVATVACCSNCGTPLGVEGYYRPCLTYGHSSVLFVKVVVPLG